MAAVETLSLEQILSYVPITGLMYEITTGLDDPLPPAFASTKKEIVGDAARLMVRRGQRKTAQRTEYVSQAKSRGLVSIGYKDMKMVHFFEVMAVDPNVLIKLRDTTNYTNQTHGREELNEQARQYAQLFRNTEIAIRQLVLAQNILYFSIDGNLLPSSSGAAYTFDFNVAASHKNQLNDGVTTIIGASWATTSTDIPGQILALKKRARRVTGLRLRYGMYTEKIPGYFASNTEVQAYLSRDNNLGMRNHFLNTGELPPGLFGLEWVPVYEEGFFEDATGTNQEIWNVDQVVFTPAPDANEWWRMQYGSLYVPRSINVSGEGAAVLDNCDIRYGMGGYGAVNLNPIRADMYYFHTFLPALQNPDAIYNADVTP